MPELPEVETVCRGLNNLTLNQKILGAEVLLNRTIAYPNSIDEFLSDIKDKIIVKWQRRGKYLIAELNPPSALGVHLRMTGQLLWCNESDPLPTHTRVRLFCQSDQMSSNNQQELRFVDQRTFGKMWFIPPETDPKTIITGLQNLGPEPFHPDFSVTYLINKLKNKQRHIKTALLDQSIIAGIGNIYADEVLFLSNIRPTTLCSNLQSQQIEKLHSHITEVLQTAIKAGGTTIRNYLNVEGVNGNYAQMAWVYGRNGQTCVVCGTLIEKIKLGGRSSHFCPKCQI